MDLEQTMCASFTSTLALPIPIESHDVKTIDALLYILVDAARASDFNGNNPRPSVGRAPTEAPRAKLPAVIFATFVVFGNQKSL